MLNARDQRPIDEERRRSGRFRLATTGRDQAHATTEQVRAAYQAQHAAARMELAVCRLVYRVGQRLLRQNLKARAATIRHQMGKQTQTPTLRWVFQVVQAVHRRVRHGRKHFSNLTEARTRILSFLSPSCRKYYLLL